MRGGAHSGGTIASASATTTQIALSERVDTGGAGRVGLEVRQDQAVAVVGWGAPKVLLELIAKRRRGDAEVAAEVELQREGGGFGGEGLVHCSGAVEDAGAGRWGAFDNMQEEVGEARGGFGVVQSAVEEHGAVRRDG
jgi:hypothetical protein